MKYPATYKSYTETDIITSSNGDKIGTVLDYWKWAHNLLLDNAERGVFAEFLVANAIKNKGRGRVNWRKYDLITKEGITIEVKSASYIQAWGQNDLSYIQFGIKKTKGYNNDTGVYDKEKKRQADIYVFCLLNEIRQDKIDVTDTNQWKFYVLSSKSINENNKYSNAQSIGIKGLEILGAVCCKYENLYESIKRIIIK